MDRSLLVFAVSSIKEFTAVFRVLILLSASILPDTSSTITMSSGTADCPMIFAAEDSADRPTRKSESPFFSMVFVPELSCFFITMLPADTDLSVQILPIFFVVSSIAIESCQWLMVTSSATAPVAADTVVPDIPNRMVTDIKSVTIQATLFRLRK